MASIFTSFILMTTPEHYTFGTIVRAYMYTVLQKKVYTKTVYCTGMYINSWHKSFLLTCLLCTIYTIQINIRKFILEFIIFNYWQVAPHGPQVHMGCRFACLEPINRGLRLLLAHANAGKWKNTTIVTNKIGYWLLIK